MPWRAVLPPLRPSGPRFPDSRDATPARKATSPVVSDPCLGGVIHQDSADHPPVQPERRTSSTAAGSTSIRPERIPLASRRRLRRLEAPSAGDLLAGSQNDQLAELDAVLPQLTAKLIEGSLNRWGLGDSVTTALGGH